MKATTGVLFFVDFFKGKWRYIEIKIASYDTSAHNILAQYRTNSSLEIKARTNSFCFGGKKLDEKKTRPPAPDDNKKHKESGEIRETEKCDYYEKVEYKENFWLL